MEKKMICDGAGAVESTQSAPGFVDCPICRVRFAWQEADGADAQAAKDAGFYPVPLHIEGSSVILRGVGMEDALWQTVADLATDPTVSRIAIVHPEPDAWYKAGRAVPYLLMVGFVLAFGALAALAAWFTGSPVSL